MLDESRWRLEKGRGGKEEEEEGEGVGEKEADKLKSRDQAGQ